MSLSLGCQDEDHEGSLFSVRYRFLIQPRLFQKLQQASTGNLTGQLIVILTALFLLEELRTKVII